MKPIRIAAQLHPQHGTWRDLRRSAIAADQLGYDILCTWDHFSPLYGEPDGAHFECWSTLAAWAECTDRIELAPLVACDAYRNPNLLADIARTVDHVSDGRVILGLGAGWFARDFERYGYDLTTMAHRIRTLARDVPTIIGRLEQLSPPPVRRMPILVAGTGVSLTLPIVAAHADIWHAAFPERPAELARAIAALRHHCDEIGREPGSIEWSVGVEPADLDRFLRDDADTYLQMGFTQFTLGFNGPDWPVEAGRAFLDWRDEANTTGSSSTPNHTPSGMVRTGVSLGG